MHHSRIQGVVACLAGGSELGSVAEIREVFVGFQEYLYAEKV